MKRMLYAIAAILISVFPLMAQTGNASDKSEQIKRYSERYDLLVSKLGVSGVGIETLLNQWAELDSTDVKLLTARFTYYFTKAQTNEIVSKNQKKYLGNAPVITLKDSTGRDVHYFQETFFDDSLYGLSVRYLDQAIKLYPDRLDLRFLKASSLMAYEKESPDMALAFLEKLADENKSGGRTWVYPGIDEVNSDFFVSSMQDYCYEFFNTGSSDSYAAFKALSEKMLGFYPTNATFLSNLGSYYLVAASDYKTALKYYNKVLKIKPDEYAAIRNCVLIARTQKNVKLEKKYLPMLVKYGTEGDKLTAEARLKSLQ